MSVKNYLRFCIVALFVVLYGCETDTIYEVKSDNYAEEIVSHHKKENGGISGGTIKTRFKLHRGRKWSKKHNVSPCSSGFGICSMEVGGSVNVEINDQDLTLKYESKGEANLLQQEKEIYYVRVFRIVFLTPIEAENGDVFISNEDGLFELPERVSNQLGYQKLTIVPENYIYQGSSEEFPYGYVDVYCLTAKS